MPAWKRGLRGSDLEDRINITIENYRKSGLALIQKIPTPITPIKLDGKGHITLAFFDQKSTVDYIGIAQTVGVCFDAKECKCDTFPLANIHEHQMLFMKDFTKQGGVAFFVLYYSHKGTYYILTYEEASRFWKRMESGGRKSFRYDELTGSHFVAEDKSGNIDILSGVNIVLSEKEKEEKMIC